MRGESNKTISTVRMTMSRSLAFLADPALAASVLPEEGESLDIPSFLRETGTLYLIAETRGEDAPVAPLFACLASEIHYTAALAGSLLPGGRLDPPLLMALDEVTQICPVPVPSWLADSGGKGIQIITVAHGEAQLRGRWGPDGARIIMDTSGAKIWLPGISDTDTLDAASALCGTTPMKETRTIFEHHRDQHDPYARHPIMTPDMIRQLPARYALIVRGGMSPVIARLPMAWSDPAYKRARRAGRAAHRRAGGERHGAGLGSAIPALALARGTNLAGRRSSIRILGRPWALPMAMNQPSHDPADVATGLMLQITQHAERLALLDQRELGHCRELTQRLDYLSKQLTEVIQQADAVHDLAGRQAALLETLDGLDQQLAALTTRLTQTTARANRDESREAHQVGASASVVESRRSRTRRVPQPTARLGRSGLPPWLRPPLRHPRPMLGPAPPVPVWP